MTGARGSAQDGGSPARGRLLQAVIAELDRTGLRDRSLRDIADAVGTSHRMLIHHFGSREGLLVAVVEEVEAEERRRSQLAHEAPPGPPAELLRQGFRRLTRPDQAGRERLFFECYARGLQGEEPFARLLPGAVHDWLELAGPVSRAAGAATAREARAGARLGLAVVRGLLLDLLATGDRRGVTEALDLYVQMVEARTPRRARGRASGAAKPQ